MVTRPLQETTSTFSARQTWIACWPPYLRNQLDQLLEWLQALVVMVIMIMIMININIIINININIR